MAVVKVGVPDVSGNIIGAGSLPASLSFAGWTQTMIGSSIVYLVAPKPAGSNLTTFLLVNYDAAGIVTSLSYGSGTGAGIPPQFTVSGLAIPLSAFMANAANIMPLLLSGNDEIRGNDFANVLYGGAGSDTLWGYGGNDRLFGGAGADALYGGDGNDLLHGGDGSDSLDGGAGDDTFFFTTDFAGTARDSANGGAGIDTADFSGLSGGFTLTLDVFGFDRIGNQYTLYGVENLIGSAYDDTLTGNGLANRIDAGSGNDVVYGGAGNDVILGAAGSDVLHGEAGADSLNGGESFDILRGGDGDDTLIGGNGGDVLDGGLGFDTVSYAASSAAVTVNLAGRSARGGEAEGDSLYSIERVYGSAFGDTLIAAETGSQLYGLNGADRIYGLAGNDILEGGDGTDTISGGGGSDRIGGGAGGDSLAGEAGNDQIYGGAGNDFLSGGDGDDVLWGEDGNDVVDGGAGNDFAVLGAGNDSFTLGAGNDRIRFDYGNGNDVIRDFGNGADILDFSFTDMTLAALQANTIQTSAGVLMILGSGTILLEGLQLWQIEWSADFVFA